MEIAVHEEPLKTQWVRSRRFADVPGESLAPRLPMDMKIALLGKSLEILIVEGNPGEAGLMRRCLENVGYRVRVAKNGEEGLLAETGHGNAFLYDPIVAEAGQRIFSEQRFGFSQP